MKKTILATMIGMAVLTGCDRSDNMNSVYTPPSEAETFNSPYVITFEGLETGTLVGTEVEFSLEGSSTELPNLDITNADAVGSAARNTTDTNEYTTTQGGFIITRTDNSSPDPISLELVVKVPGYFTTGQTITIPAESEVLDSGAGFTALTLTPLAPETEEIAITAGEEKGEATDDGEVVEEIVISTPIPESGDSNATAVAGGTVEMTIPAATTLTDKDGQPVTGTITANVVYFSNEPEGTGDLTDSALLAFPGGLSPAEIIAEDSDEVDDSLSGGTFVSAGFTAIEITNDAGQVVSNFDPAIPLTFEVSSKTINPDNGLPIKEGDEIPVWSYDETIGKWKAEGKATVGALNTATDTHTVTKLIDHLSYYNLDYWLAENCDFSVTIQESGVNQYQPAVRFTRAGGGWTKERTISGFGNHTFYNVPEEGRGTLAIRAYNSSDSSSLISSVTGGKDVTVNSDGTVTAKFCDLSGATITLTQGDVPSADYSVSLESQCSDSDEALAQPGYVQLYKYNGTRISYTTGFAVDAGVPVTTTVDPGRYQVRGYLFGNVQGDTYSQKDITLADGQELTEVLGFNAGQCGTPGGGTGGTGGNGGGGGTGS
ncbi:hypothetical protein [Vibrio astriarenae]|uniref:hypothetical protein n=1 Tax=Vibrio astriarenae TaxID=1481923 RepID=UPI0037367682